MARILSADTEAFAPSTFKPTALPERESSYDRQLRRLSAEIGLAEKAIPLADLVARGGSTLYGGIKDWFAEREQEQKAEEAKARGVKGLDDFAGTKAPSGTTATEAVASGAPAIAPNEQQIAQDRLSKLTEQYANMSPEEQQRLSEESNRVLKQKYAEEQAKAQKLQAQKFYGEHPEFARDVKSETLPQAAQALGLRDVELAQQKAISEQKWDLPRSTSRVADERAAKEAQRERDYIAKLGKQLPPEGTVVSPEREQEIMGEVTKDWFKPAQPKREIAAGRVAPQVFRDPRTGELRSVEPGYPTLGRGSLAYELEASRERPFQVGGKPIAAPSAPAADKIAQAEAIMADARRKSPGAVTPAGAQPEAWSAPATRTTVVGDPFKEGKQTIELAPTRETGAALIDKYKTAAAAEAAAKAEKEAAATPKPAAPKTIGEATDDQLKMLKSRLESVAGRNLTEEQRQDLTGRLKDINDELDYRKTKDEPRTYSQWEALARVADTPEKQARVLELAKNVHMPAGGLADLLSPSAQLAERQAMGTRGEPGLFPPMAKKTGLIELAKAAKYEAEANKINLSNPYEQALFEAKINEKLANAGYTDVKGSDVMALIAPKAVAMEELGHQRHEMADYYAARAKAEDARARFRAANRGGAGRDDMFKWGKEWNDVAAERVRAAQKVATEAIDSAEKASLKAQDSAQHASRLAEDVGKPPEPPKGLDKTNPKLVEQYQESLRKHKEREAAAAAAARAAAADRAFAEQKDGERRAAQTQLKDSVTAGDEAYREYQTLYEERRGRPIGTPPAYKQPRPAAPPIKKEAPSTAPPAAPKEGDKKDVTLKNGSKVKAVFKGGKWVRAE